MSSNGSAPNGSAPAPSRSAPGLKGTHPAALWLLRHGESAGNKARDEAEADGRAVIDIAERDMDVPLSDLGRSQAHSVGQWVAEMTSDGDEQLPTVAYVSPYVRAVQTADLALEAAGLADLPRIVDERLREREFGVLDGLTIKGIRERFPEEADRRARLGKFYHRPPGGESWADVAQRVRSVLTEIGREHAGERVLIVAHQVVILLVRYVLERLSESEILEISRDEEIANCSLARFDWEGSGSDSRDSGTATVTLRAWNGTSPLAEEGEEVTSDPDIPAGPR
jgi:broad specificity phosphatase PhoE